MKRTIQQNRALHKYLSLLADELNNAGYDMKRFLEKSEYKIDVPWTKESCKEYLAKPVIEAMFQTDSTAELTTVQMQEAYDVINRHVGEVTGVYVPWPAEA